MLACMSSGLAASVAAEVRAEMGRQNLSQQVIGEALGMSRQNAGRRLNGIIPFDVSELEKIATLLGVPVAQFLKAPERVA